AVQLWIAGGLWAGNFLTAAEWALHAELVDFAGVALPAGLDTHAHPRFIVLQAEIARDGWIELIATLPGSAEFAGLWTFIGDIEAVLDEELPRRRPDLGWRALGDQPAGVLGTLDAEIADLCRYLQT